MRQTGPGSKLGLCANAELAASKVTASIVVNSTFLMVPPQIFDGLNWAQTWPPLGRPRIYHSPSSPSTILPLSTHPRKPRHPRNNSPEFAARNTLWRRDLPRQQAHCLAAQSGSNTKPNLAHLIPERIARRPWWQTGWTEKWRQSREEARVLGWPSPSASRGKARTSRFATAPTKQEPRKWRQKFGSLGERLADFSATWAASRKGRNLSPTRWRNLERSTSSSTTLASNAAPISGTPLKPITTPS